MCGFIQRVTDNPDVKLLLIELGLGDVINAGGNFYPGSTVSNVIIETPDGPQAVDAIWWFLLDKITGKPNYKYATFNARNLESRTWANPLKFHRCLTPATGIAETLGEGKNKKSYLIQSENAFWLGGLYCKYRFNNEDAYSFAVITRPPHKRFSKYHDKSIPLFIPNDKEIITSWLAPEENNPLNFERLLSDPKITTNLKVTPVNSTRKLEPIGEPELLEADS